MGPIKRMAGKQYRLCTCSPSKILKGLDDRHSSSTSSTMNHPPSSLTGPRPIGPRSMDRSASPATTLQLPPTAPLNIRKASPLQQANSNGIQTSSSANSSTSFLSPHPPTNRGQPSPSLSLKIPTPGQQRPGKPKLKISNFTNGGSEAFDETLSIDGSFSGGYYGGAAFQPTSLSVGGPDEATIRPNSAETQTVDDLRATLRSLDINPTPPPKLSSLSSTSIHQVLSNSSQGDEWSDEFLQELDRLGEGAGGAVHKVRDKRTDMVMARKTITTREAPMKQLNRELSFMSSTSHQNIIKFYAAYISPSSSEIKLLMEFCEGGSLEAVGKRIREKGWRVSEKVAGRLAEGVSFGFCLASAFPSRNLSRGLTRADSSNSLRLLGVLDLARLGVSAHEKDHSPGYKTLKRPPVP